MVHLNVVRRSDTLLYSEASEEHRLHAKHNLHICEIL